MVGTRQEPPPRVRQPGDLQAVREHATLGGPDERDAPVLNACAETTPADHNLLLRIRARTSCARDMAMPYRDKDCMTFSSE
jgi:hypothetical protein